MSSKIILFILLAAIPSIVVLAGAFIQTQNLRQMQRGIDEIRKLCRPTRTNDGEAK